MHSGYYEAVIQVRPRKKNIEQFIEDTISGTKAKITRVKSLKTGIDFYISSWKVALAVSKSMTEKFGGSYSVSRKIFGMHKSKGRVVYRSAISYRCPEYAPGEIVAQNGSVFEITSSGRFLMGRNLVTGKKSKISQKEGIFRLSRHKVQVSKSEPMLEIIHPETFQSTPVENSRPVKANRVSVAIYGEKY